MALGADDYFVKPIDQAQFLRALASASATPTAPGGLVVGHDAGSKLEKARALGVRELDEAAFLALIMN